MTRKNSNITRRTFVIGKVKQKQIDLPHSIRNIKKIK